MTYSSYLTHLVCSDCGRQYSAEQVQTYCPSCHSPLLAAYNLNGLRNDRKRDDFASRPRGMWRWAELLPVHQAENRMSLGEGDTPLQTLSHLGVELGLSNLLFKDESKNPISTIRARSMASAISKAREFGISKVALAGTKDSTTAMLAYSRLAGLNAHICMPADTSPEFIEKIRQPGVEIALIKDLEINPNGIVEESVRQGWFDLSTFHEPYRAEGQKTIGYEIAEAMKWVLPDVIICPTGHGSAIVSLWKSFLELQELGWLETNHMPRFVAVQARGCAPLVKAFEARSEFCDYWTNSHTDAINLLVPKSFADHLVLKILYESDGIAVSVTDEAMRGAQRQMEESESIQASLEGAATFAALFKLVRQKWLKPDERILLLNTGTVSKPASP